MTENEFNQLVFISGDNRNAGRDILATFELGHFTTSYLISTEKWMQGDLENLRLKAYEDCCHYLKGEAELEQEHE